MTADKNKMLSLFSLISLRASIYLQTHSSCNSWQLVSTDGITRKAGGKVSHFPDVYFHTLSQDTVIPTE